MVNQGDIIWLDFDPQSGHEQKGRRPALVVSNNMFNKIRNYKLVMICPITNTHRDFPLHVNLGKTSKITGVIMCDQAKILDIKSRNYEKIDIINEKQLEKVLEIISSITKRD